MSGSKQLKTFQWADSFASAPVDKRQQAVDRMAVNCPCEVNYHG